MNILAENVLFFDPKVNNPRCPKNGKPLLPSWQGLTLRTSARTLGETRMALLVSTSFWFLLVNILCQIHFLLWLILDHSPLASPLTLNTSDNFVNKTKIVWIDLPFESSAPWSYQNLHSASVTLCIFVLVINRCRLISPFYLECI